MHIRVLGSAAGGGVPQWNCACANCNAARAKPQLRRTQASIAISADGERWLVANVTLDIDHQIAAFDKLAPHAPRRSPIGAIVLTDANIDHAFGLLELRQAERLSIYSTETVRDVLLAGCSALRPFAKAPHAWHVIGDSPVHVNDAAGLPLGLRIRAIDVGGLTPQYDGGREAAGAASAVIINDGAHRLLYAPCVGKMTDGLRKELALADAAFLDGTFWTEHELSLQALSSRTSRQMGHLPISGEAGTLDVVIGLGGKHRYYTHLNNTNPLLDPGSDASRVLRDAGWMIAEDGLAFSLSKEAGSATSARR
ncbi:MAG: pyrroloquinoline quinone biosynthesis protein PqqB [Candidatus Eremiobacteraeota bacterium]|nr:pyrroloquinoline quinone biosynthesis protein PqqB [Candidatus Eremiobacteraeota bacterium]